jgi:hypothetical protein
MGTHLSELRAQVRALDWNSGRHAVHRGALNHKEEVS